MNKVNHPLKARMYIGGLKSLFVDLVNEIEQIETNGVVSNKFIENLSDVKAAVDLTLSEFKKVTIKCCEHGEAHDDCDETCEDSAEDDECEECGVDPCACKEGYVEDDVIFCEECGEIETDCDCWEEPPPPVPVRKTSAPVKKESKVVSVPSKQRGKRQ